MLVVALKHHEGSLRASLMAEYGLRLGEARTWPAREVADLVAWLPAGCALWIDWGGPVALSAVERALQVLDYSVRVVDYHVRKGKGSKPKEPKTPPTAAERRAEQDRMDRKANRYFRRAKGRQEPS